MKSQQLFRMVGKILLYTLGFIILAYVLTFFIYRDIAVFGKVEKHLIDILISLKKSSAAHTEYPVGALLIYNDSIIGKGYNTFIELNDPTGHAEINALRNAFEKITYKDLLKLDQRKLILLTSYEPCMMCIGMCGQYGIKKVYYLQKKPAYLRWRNMKIEFMSKYRIRKLKV